MTSSDSIRQAFDNTASRYDEHAVLEREVGVRLLERLVFRRDEPGVVLDLGAGTGTSTADLRKSFKKALVTGLDLSGGMLERAGRRSTLGRRFRRVQGDMVHLPFARHSVDVVHSNLALPWLRDAPGFFGEVARVLKPGGLFLFSAFGPDSLSQLFGAGRAQGIMPVETAFHDILQLGDLMQSSGFREPVMDIDRITLEYRDIPGLLDEMKMTGTALLVQKFSEADDEMLAKEWPGARAGRLPLDFEILYGLAFGPDEGQPRRTPDGEVATFSVDALLKSRTVL